MKKKIKCSLILICCYCLCSAQQVVSSGGYAVKSEIYVDWVLGGSLMDISTIDLISLGKIKQDQMIETESSFKLYPNPAYDLINIEVSPIYTTQIILELYNNSGVKVLDKPVPYQPVIQIDISNIPSGIYLLKVNQPSINYIQFRVEKIVKL